MTRHPMPARRRIPYAAAARRTAPSTSLLLCGLAAAVLAIAMIARALASA